MSSSTEKQLMHVNACVGRWFEHNLRVPCGDIQCKFCIDHVATMHRYKCSKCSTNHLRLNFVPFECSLMLCLSIGRSMIQISVNQSDNVDLLTPCNSVAFRINNLSRRTERTASFILDLSNAGLFRLYA